MKAETKLSRRAQDRLRRDAAAWFARMRGPDAEARRPAFDAWRQADPHRQAAYDRLLRLWDESAVLSRTRFTTPTARRLAPPKRLARGAAIGLAAAGVLTAAWVWPATTLWPQGWPIPALAPYRLSTAIGQIRQVRLWDGSSMTLDTDTMVTTDYTASARTLRLLQGRARFDVAHDRARPFVVEVAGGAVIARGTLFDVAFSPEDDAAVTLMRGVVEVRANAHDSRAAAVSTLTRLAPGQSVAFGGGFTAPRLQPCHPCDLTWPSGSLSFQETPLSQALAEANRYSRQHIVLKDPALAPLQVSGVFPASAQPDLAASLAAAFTLRVDPAPNGDLVLSRLRSAPAAASSPPG